MVNKPVLKLTPKGTPLCSFCIATTHNYRTSNERIQEISYFDVEAWGTLAELCYQNGIKRRAVRIVGRLKQGRWVGTGGKNGNKVKLIAEHVEFKPLAEKENEGVNYNEQKTN